MPAPASSPLILTRLPLVQSSSPRTARPISASDSPPGTGGRRPGDMTAAAAVPVPTSAVSSSHPWRTRPQRPPSQIGLRPALTAQPLVPWSTDQLSSEERISTLRRSVSSLRTEVTSLEKVSSVTAGDLAVSFMEKLPADNLCGQRSHGMIEYLSLCSYLYQT